MKLKKYLNTRLESSDWLWDRKFAIQEARQLLKNPMSEHFLSLAGLLLSRKNTPKEVFKHYLRPLAFFRSWPRIKVEMRKNKWNNPRIEFWQAIYEKLKEKYKEKGILPERKAIAGKSQNTFCKAVADQIKATRKQKGLTQQELAKRLNVSQQMISSMESGRENISLLTLKNIVDNLEAKIQLEIKI